MPRRSLPDGVFKIIPSSSIERGLVSAGGLNL